MHREKRAHLFSGRFTPNSVVLSSVQCVQPRAVHAADLCRASHLVKSSRDSSVVLREEARRARVAARELDQITETYSPVKLPLFLWT